MNHTYKLYKAYYLLAIVAILMAACNSRNANKLEYISSFMNQEIFIPDDLVYLVDNDTITPDFKNTDFKILTCISAENCIPCKMNLTRWSKLIEELQSHRDLDIDFLMIVNSPRTEDLLSNIKKANFLNPITFDPDNKFKKMNELPEGDINTFLLDEENRIIAMGDPSVSPKIHELYRKLMKIDVNRSYGYNLFVQPVMSLGSICANDTIVKRFTLANNSTEPLIIQDVIPSCDCIHTDISSDTITPNGQIFLSVTLPVEGSSGLMRKYIDVFLKEKDNPEQLTLYGYIINNSNIQINEN